VTTIHPGVLFHCSYFLAARAALPSAAMAPAAKLATASMDCSPCI
jgi:hypothetical protein